jgi:hypothetical protein
LSAVHLRAATTIVLLAFGCNDSPDGDSSCLECSSTLVDDTSAPLECTQPLGAALTWPTFADPFFRNWCTSCHSSDLDTKEERQSAPPGMNFDTYAGVVEHAVAIKYRAVTAEPKYLMPPNGGPDLKERELLGLWIDCGLKEH